MEIAKGVTAEGAMGHRNRMLIEFGL